MSTQEFVLSFFNALPSVLSFFVAVYVMQPLFKDTGVSHAVWFFKKLAVSAEVIATVEAEAKKHNKKSWETAMMRLGLAIAGGILYYAFSPIIIRLVLRTL